MNQKHSKTAVARFTQEERQLALDALSAGQIPLTAPVRKLAVRMTAINIAGYALLKNHFEDMKPDDIAFCGSMYHHQYEDLSPKQAQWLADLLKRHMNTKLELLTDKDIL